MKPDPLKLRQLNAQVGRWVLITQRGSPEAPVHRATIIPVYPTGRQIYPRLDYKLHCDSVFGSGSIVLHTADPLNNDLVTCEGCRSKEWRGIIQNVARTKAIRVEHMRRRGHMMGLTTP